MRPKVLFLLTFLVACDTEPTSVSNKQRVQAKSGAVWSRDVAQGLGLSEWSLCSELGAYDCVSEAHLVTLGGVEPTRLGVDDPLPNAAVSAPIAVDRVASSACTQRYDLDKTGPAVVFGPIFEADTAANRNAVAGALVQRLLARDASDAEIDAITGLYDQLGPIATDVRRDWSVGACVMVATSTEALFY